MDIDPNRIGERTAKLIVEALAAGDERERSIRVELPPGYIPVGRFNAFGHSAARMVLRPERTISAE